MSVSYGTWMPRANLVWDIDASNYKKNPGYNNLEHSETWQPLGSGSCTGYNRNGTDAENQRIIATGPFGEDVVCWDTPSNDETSDADGGWNGAIKYAIDPYYYYRFSVWVKRPTLIASDGNFYLGLYGYNDAGGNAGVLRRDNGANNTNHYWFSSTFTAYGLSQDTWYLAVGHAHPVGSGTGSAHANTGIWNLSGSKAYTGGLDCVWQAEINTQTILRTYLYYSTNANTSQRWYQPRIDKIDGTEPSLSDLIAGSGTFCYNSAPNANTNYSVHLCNGAYLNRSNIRSFVFDGTDDNLKANVSVNAETGGNNHSFSVSAWIKRAATGANHGIVSDLQYAWWVFYVTSGDKLYWRFKQTDALVTTTQSSASIGTDWTMVTGVYTLNTSTKLYINGVLDTTNTSNTYPFGLDGNRGPRWIGVAETGAAGSLANPMNGEIGKVSLWNRPLSGDEVARMFHAQRGRFGV